ncbi:uncharacterized protein SCHCODRAFT_02608895 [Schizophyllum commune H4-8]|uniref:uncharacterized protein n=1 Tax=Schizophyllum commune (strain H4-8 / FGSC 9210) TaxID=578458 RepID=UPI0021600720|nr:uncharacterized protein SCHCODRAFT_02608895 [Schizophyllum commune H4-8]KAI5900835.1 hypothetical protein SCHCODRAFT_02608895 [Schizophyllum commune H4-8]
MMKRCARWPSIPVQSLASPLASLLSLSVSSPSALSPAGPSTSRLPPTSRSSSLVFAHSNLVRAIAVLLLQSFLVTRAEAFQWVFNTSQASTNLQVCDSFGVNVSASSLDEGYGDVGTGPYYMLAFPVNGTPTTQHIGDSVGQLSWTANHEPGTQLFLSVVDSNNATGGIPQSPYNIVAANGNTSCVPSSEETDFEVWSNLTSTTLETCQPWGLRIRGGSPPYTVYLMSLGATVITNATMGPDNDAYTYINRAGPGSQMIAGVSDKDGKWASGSPWVRTTGSTDVLCDGMQSSFGVASELDNPSSNKESESKSPAPLAIGLALGLGIPILLLGVFLFVRWQRRRGGMGSLADDPSLKPTAYFAPYAHSAATGPDSAAAGDRNRMDSMSKSGTGAYHDKGHDTTASPTSRRTEASADARFPPGLTLASSTRQSSKGSPVDTRSPVDLRGSPTATRSRTDASSPSDTRSPADLRSNPTSRTSGGDEHDGVDEVIIQHRDAGPQGQRVIRELPPPYTDLSEGGEETR